MPLAEPHFSELVQRLEGESGMRRKVRVLANSWSELRQLSPAQRERLALVIGNRWAWRNIEGYFGKTGKLSDNQTEVKEFFESLRETDPDELQEIGSEIRQGGFAEAAKHVLGAVDEALDDETDGEVEAHEAVEAEPEPMQEAPVLTPPAAPPGIEVEESEPETSEAPAEEPEERPKVAPPVGVEPVATVATKPPPKQVEREPEPKPVAIPETVIELVPVPADSAVEPIEGVRQPFVPLRSDGKAPSAVESLRALRQLSVGEAPSTRPARAAMVRSLTSGWAARRAVSALIRSHSAADLDEALALIRQLPTATQQAWCLGDLVEHWDLDDTERRLVLATAPTSSAKNRLTRRAERAG